MQLNNSDTVSLLFVRYKYEKGFDFVQKNLYPFSQYDIVEVLRAIQILLHSLSKSLWVLKCLIISFLLFFRCLYQINERFESHLPSPDSQSFINHLLQISTLLCFQNCSTVSLLYFCDRPSFNGIRRRIQLFSLSRKDQ